MTGELLFRYYVQEALCTGEWEWPKLTEERRRRWNVFASKLIERQAVIEALRMAQRIHTEALPKFSWGSAILDAEAITLLNTAPAVIARALALVEAQ